jgi:hypothetical protein
VSNRVRRLFIVLSALVVAGALLAVVGPARLVAIAGGAQGWLARASLEGDPLLASLPPLLVALVGVVALVPLMRSGPASVGARPTASAPAAQATAAPQAKRAKKPRSVAKEKLAGGWAARWALRPRVIARPRRDPRAVTSLAGAGRSRTDIARRTGLAQDAVAMAIALGRTGTGAAA